MTSQTRTYADLEKIGNIKCKLDKLEEVLSMFSKEVGFCKTESLHLTEYMNELKNLTQEKLAHVEELRQINCDINQLETAIKQAQNEQVKAMEDARRHLAELLPLKEEINRLRLSINQDPLPDNIVSEETISLLLQFEQQNSPMRFWYPEVGTGNATSLPLLGCQSKSVNPVLENSIPEQVSFSQRPTTSNFPFSIAELSMSTSFLKQQPPPMKTCTSCQQQIHRNAPICPLCKSKSRSKNPKKAKARKASGQLN
ncbi:Zinc finger C4H2 domain-containing protein [Trichinella pseudospiralis]|uniref:Zinc finger C4H2 domain-containing protein n=2 Tax=Trichinella pseudospiralis TaxID=6337 RepID=A0A0V0XWA8_TRIPS|nr:Zinc finger C4H2 domain-containing protein [Trichinella pseudospiralis]KRY72475.1 Zinc finger C4H2 domain-containing protein [Trichinella pseudospiralis]KRY72476.1 Zinc finger C4H2 domain-containing protein [Trichinella pseudospiralis]KRZ21526.1 Zinc finger C4H2 domain-containing protein [Trichinella pseudospiralis]KRZ21527.1 Zinc finger C4H2 domain-containing protein [Trichinella pseudospiralis]